MMLEKVLMNGIVLGLVAVLIAASVLPCSSTASSATSIYVSHNGRDEPACLKGDASPCQSLGYVIGNVQGNATWTVFVLGSQDISSSDIATIVDLGNSSLSLVGDGFCSINFPKFLRLTNFHHLSFRNLTLTRLPQFRYGVFIEFTDCLIMANSFYEDYQFALIYEIQFLQCIFRYILDYNRGLYTVLDFQNNNAKQYFINCTFINGGYSPFLLFITDSQLPEPAIILLDGCVFHQTNTKLIQYFWQYTSNWIIFVGEYDVIINNSIFSKAKISAPHSLISGGDNLRILISNTLFSHNELALGERSALVSFQYVGSVELFNVTFHSNIGAGLLIANGEVNLTNVSFFNNTGVNGGGVNIAGTTIYANATFNNLYFRDNKFSGLYGGAVYIGSDPCALELSQTNTVFYDETQFVFFAINDKCVNKQFQNFHVMNIKTTPYNIQMLSNSTVSLFPGQPILIQSLKITDYYGHNTHCTSTLHLDCSVDQTSNCHYVGTNETEMISQVALEGNKLLFVQTADQLQTALYLTTKFEYVLPQPHLRIKIDCVAVSAYLNIRLKECPLGYVFDYHSTVKTRPNEMGICKKATNDTNIVYNKVTGVVCIIANYWYGGMLINGRSVNITAPCSLPYCSNDEPCPIDGYADSHYKLPWTQDEQCSAMRGGALCKSCKNNSVFTFGASRCLSLHDCEENWQPFLILSLAIGGQVVLTIFMISLKPATASGVGYLYGPLFFIAIYRLLPISHTLVHSASHLDIVFSLYQSILLLDLNILGKIPWCFFQGVDQTLIYSLRFLGPLITFSVLVVITLVARINFCYRKFNKLMFQSPIQPMCLLMILSFWSLSNTSIEIIKPIIIEGEWRFAIQPEYKYLGNVYVIVLWCIAVALLILIYLPFILLLFFSQCLRRKINLFHIEPLLDAFQASYRTKCHWYSGVYFLAWVVLNVNMPLYFFIIVLSGVSLLHFLTQPHEKWFLNSCETFLLIDLMILLSLSFLCDHDYCSHPVAVLNYPFLIIPLLYMLIGGIWLITKDTMQKWKAKLMSRLVYRRFQTALVNLEGLDEQIVLDREDKDVRSKLRAGNVLEVVLEREPLIFDDV